MPAMSPRIITREEHSISRKMLSSNTLRTLYRLHQNGFIAYLVGGCVRDLLLDRAPKDFDIATDATPNQIKRLFRNCRLVGRRFRLAHLHFQDEILEVSTFRAPTPSDEEKPETRGEERRPPRHLKDGEGMVLRDNVFGTPEEEALRRDFTMNALAYNIADFTVIDYTCGLEDIAQRIIRPIGDPHVRFTEDPVRMIRAVRFAASHRFTIESTTWEALCALAPIITRASPARLYEEIQKLFLKGSAEAVFGLLLESGLLAALFPALNRWLDGNEERRALVVTNLRALDRLVRSETDPSPALFLVTLFGPCLEGEALARSWEGVPHLQALSAACESFMKEVCAVVTVPARISTQMRSILAFQPGLHRMPPRRPTAMIRRSDFADAMTYLAMTATTKNENRVPLQWWQAYLANSTAAPENGTPTEEEAVPKRRRKRHRRRSRPNGATSGETPAHGQSNDDSAGGKRG